MRLHWLVLLPSLSIGCFDEAPDPDTHDEDVHAPPTAKQVQERITATYRHPSMHKLVGTTDDHNVITWDRTYDGIEMLTTGKSMIVDGYWSTRFVPELEEPPLVPRAALVRFDTAAATIGIADHLRTGAAVARYVYKPVFIQRPNKAVVTNAIDLDLFVEKYILAIEIADETDKTITMLDATTSAVLSRVSREQSFTYPAQLWAPTYHYPGSAPISVTAERQGRSIVNYTFQDTTRCSLMVPTSTGGSRCLNGQGILTYYDYVPNPRVKLTYEYVNTNIDDEPPLAWENDVASALDKSWDYFLEVHNRRGLRNQPAGTLFSANDAIVRRISAFPVTNADIDSQTGLITLNYSTNSPTRQAEFERIIRRDVIGHEWSHAVWRHEARNDALNYYYFGEEGGIDESSADLFGELIDSYARWKLGYAVAHEQPDFVHGGARDMCTPTLGDQPYDSWFPGMDNPNMNAHDSSGPVNRVHCLITRGLRPFGTSPDVPGLESVYVRGPGFPGIGIERVEKLWYRTMGILRGYPSPLRFVDARQAELIAAQQLFGLYSDEYKAVEDAWAAILVGLPAERTPPVVTLLTPGPLSTGNLEVEVSATDSDGVQSVTFQVDGSPETTVYAAPWRYTVSPIFLEGQHTLRVTATDLKKTSQTYEFSIVIDTTGPAVTLTDETLSACADYQLCPEYRTKRRYRVRATDASGVSSQQLLVDWGVVASASGADNVFTYSFPSAGYATVSARASDPFQQQTQTPNTSTFIDVDAPSVTTPTVAVSTTIDGDVEWKFCVSDVSIMYATRMALDIDGARTPGSAHLYSPGCYRFIRGNVPQGNHTYVVHVFDRWGNETTRTGPFFVARIPPTVTTPTAAVSTSTMGTVTISTKVTAPYGTRRIFWNVCTYDWHGCFTTIAITEPNSSSDNLTTYSLTVNGLAAGTYNARITVIGNNTIGTEKYSSTFVIPSPPPPGPIVFNESEPNDATANNVMGNVQQIKGTYNPGPPHPIYGYRADFDRFRIAVPAGKTLHVRSNFKCNDDPTNALEGATVYIGRLNQSNQLTSDGSAEANGSIAFDVPAWSNTAATMFEISVSYQFLGNAACATPAYTLNLTM